MKAILLAGLALTTLPLTGDTPRFVVEKDDMLSSAWKVSATRETLTATLGLMGNDQDVGSGAVSTSHRTVEFSDEFPAVAKDGSPLTITRSYETISTETEREGGEREDVVVLETEGDSDLTGASVIFTYDPEAEDWSAAYAEGSEGEEDWLEELSPRVDLARLLEGLDEDSEVGASWDVSPAFLMDVLQPGGDVIQIATPERDDIPEGGVQLTLPGADSIKRFEDLEGDVTATFEEIVEEDDMRLAKIVVEVNVAADLDIIEELEGEADERGSGETYTDATLARSLEGQLTILWNLEANRPESIEGELSGSSEMAVEWSMSAGQGEIEITFQQETDIAYEIEATFGD